MYKNTLSWCVYTPGKELLIHASKLASCAGMNFFQDPLELAEEWRQTISGEKEPIFDVDAGIAALPCKVRGLIHAAKTSVYETPQEAVAAVEEIKKAVEKEEEEEEEKEKEEEEKEEEEKEKIEEKKKIEADHIIEHVRSQVYTQHGTQKEASVLKAIGARKSGWYNKARQPIIMLDDLEVYVGGRLDGSCAETGRIVEVKTRMRRFMGVPKYEKVQVHAYMHILGMREAELVEMYGGETRRHVVEFDDEFWAGVVDRVYLFVRDLDGI